MIIIYKILHITTGNYVESRIYGSQKYWSKYKETTFKGIREEITNNTDSFNKTYNSFLSIPGTDIVNISEEDRHSLFHGYYLLHQNDYTIPILTWLHKEVVEFYIENYIFFYLEQQILRSELEIVSERVHNE